MRTFHELVESRKAWIAQVLKPWCRVASRRDLLMAEQEWVDLAGRPAPEKTLWLWAWSRFPALVEEELATIDETRTVTVRCRDGRTGHGFPDARQSERGELILVSETGETAGPFSIDEIMSVE